MISKTKIDKRLSKKTNPSLKRTIILLKKQKDEIWHKLAKDLSRPNRKTLNVNLNKIDKYSKQNQTIAVPGKVLSIGTLNKQITIAAISYSEKALERIKSSGSKAILLEELAKNSKGEIHIIR